MPIFVHEFYEAYGQVIPKTRSRVLVMEKPLGVVQVWGLQVPCGETEINDVLDYIFRSWRYLKDLMWLQTFEDIKGWLAPLLGISAPLWLKKELIIEKNKLNIPIRFWFWLIGNNLMPSQKWICTSPCQGHVSWLYHGQIGAESWINYRLRAPL